MRRRWCRPSDHLEVAFLLQTALETVDNHLVVIDNEDPNPVCRRA